MNWITKVLGVNWKTNLAAALTFIATVPAVVTAFQQWSHHKPADWRGAVIGLIVAGGLAVAKDASTHSTAEQVQAATDKVSEKKS